MSSPRVFWIILALSVFSIGVAIASWMREAGEHSVTRQELAAVQNRLRLVSANLTEANARNDTLTENLKTLQGQLSQTQQTLMTATTDLASTRLRLDTSVSQADQLRTQLAQSQAQAQILQISNATLTARVRGLEAQQAQYYVSSFACTGSMEPYITCADDAVFKSVIVPSNIQVGTVISFAIPPTCRFGDSLIRAHRVLGIMLGNGGFQYQTKGDNLPSPDPCLIPFNYVKGVLALLRKNTHPESVIDTSEYKLAQSKLNTLSVQSDLALQRYNGADALYNGTYTQLCGKVVGTCYLPTTSYDMLKSLQNNVDSLWSTYKSAVDAYIVQLSQVKLIECRLFKICGYPIPRLGSNSLLN